MEDHCNIFRPCPDFPGPLGRVRNHHPAAPRDPPLPHYPVFLPEQLAPLGNDGQGPYSCPSEGKLAELFRPPVAPAAPECLGRRLIIGFALIHRALGSTVLVMDGKSGFLTDLYLSGTTFFTLDWVTSFPARPCRACWWSSSPVWVSPFSPW